MFLVCICLMFDFFVLPQNPIFLRIIHYISFSLRKPHIHPQLVQRHHQNNIMKRNTFPRFTFQIKVLLLLQLLYHYCWCWICGSYCCCAWSCPLEPEEIATAQSDYAAEEEDEREILILNTLCCKQYSKKPINKYSQIRNSIGYNFRIGEHIYIRRYVLYRLIPEAAGIEGCLRGSISSEISLQGFFPAWYLIISSSRTTFTGTIILIIL